MERAINFSIIIATYNRAYVLPRAIESVCSQTYKDWELIVVDDGSTDSTEEIVHTFSDSRIRYIRLPENQGASAARNRGIEEARGQYVVVWDSDDELYPEALHTLADALTVHSDVGIVSAPAIPMKGDTRLPYDEREEGFVSLPQILAKYLPNNEKVRAARTELYRSAKYRSWHLDFMVAAYLARQASWYHLTTPLGVVYVDTPDSLTRKRKNRSIERSVERAEHLSAFIDDFGSILSQVDRKRLAAHAYGAAIGLYLAGNPDRAARFSSLANDSAPGTLRYLALYVAVRLPWLRSIVARLY